MSAKRSSRWSGSGRRPEGVALVMVLLVLGALAIIAAPFVISMALQEKSTSHFDGGVKARLLAQAARNHALAQLEESVLAVEVERAAAEAGVRLEEERSSRRTRAEPAPSPRRSGRLPRRRRGLVVREDLGEKSNDRRRDALGEGASGTGIGGLRSSQKGPGPEAFDPPEDLESELPEELVFPATAKRLAADKSLAERLSAQPAAEAAKGASAGAGGAEILQRLDDPRGLSAAVEVVDEQGKIHLDSAPPNLLANLFGVSVLAEPLAVREADAMVLEDASQFPSDGDPKTIDGAVVLAPPGTFMGEVVTFRSRRGNRLEGLFRSALFSRRPRAGKDGDEPIPRGTLVWDLRGWKLGFHRLRGGGEAEGFGDGSLRRFATVEAAREIADWQVASFFLSRVNGEGLSAQFLAQNGIRAKDLEEAGIDPALFEVEDRYRDGPLKAELDAARRTLRRLRVANSLVDKLEKLRGPRAVIAWSMRLEPLSIKEADAAAEALEAQLARTARAREPRLDPDFVRACLENLGEVLRRPGIETLRPQDLELLRDAVTVSSSVPALWSPAQILPGDSGEEAEGDGRSETAQGATLRLELPGRHGGGTIVRLRGRGEGGPVEHNLSLGGGPLGFRLLLPLANDFGPRGALIDFQERHPVNVNTASARVLRAVFTGVAGARRGTKQKKKEDDQSSTSAADAFETPGWVTPAEAQRLVARVLSSRPLRGPEQLYERVLAPAAAAAEIDGPDLQPLWLNALQPAHHELAVSTTGFCYASGDVYAIESRGILRNAAGGEVTQSVFRELIEVSASRPLRWTMFTQADWATEVFYQDPYAGKPSRFGFPENLSLVAAPIPGRAGHLVRSTPVLLKQLQVWIPPSGETSGPTGRASQPIFPVAGAERGTLRLESPESMANASTWEEVLHFRDGRDEALDLPGGEPYALDISINPGGGAGVGSAPAAQTSFDLANLPAAVEAWVRFRVFPSAVTADGLTILMDAGSEEERNRLSLLYDRGRSEWVARILDSSLPDPSIRRGEQRIEIRARRPLDLDTWYHLRLAWDGAYAGGVQLFLDGLPVGRPNYLATLATTLPAQSRSMPVPENFPSTGVLRVGGELIEVDTGVVRVQPASDFSAWLAAQPGSLGKAALQANLRPLMRGAFDVDAGNNRGTVRADHAAGTTVALHGYALKLVRKLRQPNGADVQAATGEMLLGRGGLQLLEDLWPFRLPTYPTLGTGRQNELQIVTFVDNPLRPGAWNEAKPGNANAPVLTAASNPRAASKLLVPMFRYPFQTVGEAYAAGVGCELLPPSIANRRASLELYTGAFESQGQTFDAADFFQSRGVVKSAGMPFRYVKEVAPLPASDPAARADAWVLVNRPMVGIRQINVSDLAPTDHVIGIVVVCRGQTRALRVQSAYPSGVPDPVGFWHGRQLELSSLLATGDAASRYPPSGVLQIRGAPPAWQRDLRPRDHTGSLNVFAVHPDDAIETLRYYQVERDMFIGVTSRHRDYPRAENHMFHRRGETIGQMLELGDAGAGFGDYVSIVTDDPKRRETRGHRVYHVFERIDGRFFVSLLDPLSGRPSDFNHDYLQGMNPRLVKFPTGLPPQVTGGKMLFFGDAIQPAGAAGSGASPAFATDLEEEPTTGHVLDEIRRSVDRGLLQYTAASRGQPLGSQLMQYVLVPLTSGQVQKGRAAQNGELLEGAIDAERSIGRQNPLEVLVVSLGDPGGVGPYPFAGGAPRGILSINGEIFAFENPNTIAATSGGQAVSAVSLQGRATLPQLPPNAAPVLGDGLRHPLERVLPVDLDVSNVRGHFEKEGFAMVNFHSPDLVGFREVFYYESFSGGGFHGCLRGQFRTPVAGREAGGNNPVAFSGTVHNAALRLRLVGRALLGTRPRSHSFGDRVAHLPFLEAAEISGALTETSIPVVSTEGFHPPGYLLLDSGMAARPFELIAFDRVLGKSAFGRPRDLEGKGILRGCFGTVPQPLGQGLFAFDMPFRHFDRYQAEVDSSALARWERSFRVPGARWRTLRWKERLPANARERLCDLVVLARFDGAPGWGEKPTNQEGGLFFFESGDTARDAIPSFPLGVAADQLDLRVLFRYQNGAFRRLSEDHYADDWKETPALEALELEYEKDSRVLRHEETRF